MTLVHVTHNESFFISLIFENFVVSEVGFKEKNQGGTAEYFVPCIDSMRGIFFVTSEKSRKQSIQNLIIIERGSIR